ncbi:hypothetical protein HYV50_04140 [Candidatus Pacearchaeota archaeon]|nr:hypothetical protein [Candidatus Pacearchaeota archaeon]
MVDQNPNNKINEKKTSDTKRQKILEWFRNYEPLTIPIIKSKLSSMNLGTSKTSIKKDYIDLLLTDRLIFALKKKSKKNPKKKLLEIAYEKDWSDERRNIYYVYTPRSADFYQDLILTINQFSNKEKFIERVNKVLDFFQYLEVIARYERNKLFSDKFIKKALNRKTGKNTKKLDDKQIIEAKKNALMHILAVSNLKKGIQINHKDGFFKTKEGRVFFKVTDDHFVSLRKLKEFLNLPIKRMSNMMTYISNKEGFDKEHATKPMMQELTYLFIEIEGAKYLME